MANKIVYSYHMAAAEPDSWRTYDEEHPEPNYFDFDWIIARHPDLYHKFASGTADLMQELFKVIDFTGLTVADIGAGTGVAVIEAAKKAKEVLAYDVYDATMSFGREKVREAGLTNVTYAYGDCNQLPREDNSVDAIMSMAAGLNIAEAYRILRNGGYIIQTASPPGSPYMGEMYEPLREEYPKLVREVSPEQLRAWKASLSLPPSDSIIPGDDWDGAPVLGPKMAHDFTNVYDYGSVEEMAAIYGRFYGPKVKKFVLDRNKSTVAWRSRIYYARVKKIPGFALDPKKYWFSVTPEEPKQAHTQGYA